MGHAGAIISGGTGTAAEKMAAFQAAGVPVARIPSEIPGLIAEAMQRRRPRAGAAPASRTASKTKARSTRTAPPAHRAKARRKVASAKPRSAARKPARAGRSRTR
jgi:hypothetical protein